MSNWMSKLKYTHGPWMVEVHDQQTDVINDYFTVASNLSNDDAALVAAAPDMYEALLLIKKLITDGEDVMQSLEMIVDSTLAKAEGGS